MAAPAPVRAAAPVVVAKPAARAPLKKAVAAPAAKPKKIAAAATAGDEWEEF
ncbi:hypothetical protein D9M68_828880 [compost metagenome]